MRRSVCFGFATVTAADEIANMWAWCGLIEVWALDPEKLYQLLLVYFSAPRPSVAKQLVQSKGFALEPRDAERWNLRQVDCKKAAEPCKALSETQHSSTNFIKKTLAVRKTTQKSGGEGMLEKIPTLWLMNWRTHNVLTSVLRSRQHGLPSRTWMFQSLVRWSWAMAPNLGKLPWALVNHMPVPTTCSSLARAAPLPESAGKGAAAGAGH